MAVIGGSLPNERLLPTGSFCELAFILVITYCLFQDGFSLHQDFCSPSPNELGSSMNPSDSKAPDTQRVGKYDNQGHPMSSWDHHYACRSCLRSIRQVCCRAAPCEVCKSWTDQMWRETENAERRLEVKRLARLKKQQAKAMPDTSLMPPPLGVPRKSRKPQERDRSAGEDADWSPVEHSSPSVTSALPSI